MERRALAVIALVALAGCVGPHGSGGHGPRSHAVQASGIEILIFPPPDELPFNPRGARFVQVTNDLMEIAGRGIQFEIDAALAPEGRSSFEEELIQSIQNVAKDLAAIKKESPHVFARAMGLLDKVTCRYKATAPEAASTFVSTERRVLIEEPPQGAFVARGLVRGALYDEYQEHLDQLYRAKSPDEIPPGEREAYFEFLTESRPGFGVLSERKAHRKLRDLPESERLASDPHAETILRVARLGEILGRGGDPLSVAVREWLVKEADHYRHAYETRAELIPRLPQGSVWKRAEAGWIRWLNASLPSLTDAQKIVIARAVYSSRGACRESDPCLDQPASFPGFDRLGFGFGIVDQWRADGHPTEGEGKRFELEDEVVCPHRTREDERRDRNRSCNQAFYQQAMATDASRARLVKEVVRRGDPRFVDEVFANADYVPAPRVMATWRGLEPHTREWQTAARVIIEHLLGDRGQGEAIEQEANRLWRDVPDRRGTALLILAHSTRGMDRHYSDPRWADFSKRYGEPVSQRVFMSYLDHGSRALKLVPVIWPALAKDFARGEPIVSHLDRFLDDPRVQRSQEGEPSRTLRAIAGRLCDENATQDLARLHAYLQQRAKAHPAEAAPLATLIVDTSRCKKPAKAESDR